MPNVLKKFETIQFPKLVKEYKSSADIMGIDLGSTRCVLAVSRENRIHIVNIDKGTSGDQRWIESVISFDEEPPIIGEPAIRRLRTKPEYVIMDWKLSCDRFFQRWRSHNINTVWSSKTIIKDGEEPCFKVQTINGEQQFSLADLNSIFLETMKKIATEYQMEHNDSNEVKKAVITVPQYPNKDENNYWMDSILKAATMAGIEVIDIIKEVHADLLYYLSNQEYKDQIKTGDKIAIFDIGGGTGICRIYEIIENNSQKQAKIYGYIKCKLFGRDIDDKLMQGIEWQLHTKMSYLSKVTISVTIV